MRALIKFTAAIMCFLGFATSASYAADSLTLTARVYPVGKWAEGMAYDGKSLWVAESGQRSIAQIDFDRDGRVARHVNVGRLPVNMVRGNDGAIYTLVQTDRLIWQQYPDRQGKAIGGLEGCPNGLANSAQYLWVLTWPDCSSNSGRVLRVDPRSGQKASSATLAEYGNAIVEHQGKVWVAHGRGPALSIVDGGSLAVSKADVQGASLQAITANGANVYVAGMLGAGSNQGLVALMNPPTMRETRRQLVDQPVAVIAADDRSVVAVGNKGKVWVFSAANLDLQRTITVNAGRPIDPKAVLIVGESLFVTNGQQQGENGAVLYMALWRPAQVQAAPPVPSATPSPSPGGASSSAGPTDCPYQVVNVNASTGLWMYEDPDLGAPKVVGIPPNSRGLVADRCLQNWCHVTFRGQSGWVERRNLQATCN